MAERKKISFLSGITIYGLLSLLLFSCNGENRKMEEKIKPSKHVLLLGASVGAGWDFPGLPERMQNDKYKIEFRAKYDPDKTDLLEEVIKSKADRPDIIIIKQCAAYFPANSESYDSKIANRYKKLAKGWIEKCKKNDIIPILATVVPITEKMPLWPKTKRMIKKYILRKKIYSYNRNIRQQGINEYNDWVLDYADKNALTVLDLESVLRISRSNRYLVKGLSTDGLHLNKKAYEMLDRVVIETLAKAE